MEERKRYSAIDTYCFLSDLLSYAIEPKREDLLLSGCVRELIRHIWGMDDAGNVVNHGNLYSGYEYALLVAIKCYDRRNYFVYDLYANFFITKDGEQPTCLSRKKLKEICEKCPSKNQSYLQYVERLETETLRLETILQTPIERWDAKDYSRFNAHLIEDAIVDIARGIKPKDFYFANGSLPGFEWYHISNDELRNMGIRKYVNDIFLYTRLNTINICFKLKSYSKPNKYVQALLNYADYIGLMPITFGLSDYKEKFQYAQSIMDRLIAEFRV